MSRRRFVLIAAPVVLVAGCNMILGNEVPPLGDGGITGVDASRPEVMAPADTGTPADASRDADADVDDASDAGDAAIADAPEDG